jgi:hypothetical protein
VRTEETATPWHRHGEQNARETMERIMCRKIIAIAVLFLLPALGACEMDILGLDELTDDFEEAWSTRCCFDTGSTDVQYTEVAS